MTLRLLVLASAATVALGAAPARADGPAAGSVLRQEWIGAEVVPLSFNQGSPPYGGDHPSRVQPGAGLQLRLFRHRWLHGPTWTPIQIGNFYGWGADGDWTFLLCAQTELGGVIRIGDQAVELGIGVGAGIIWVRYSEINTSALVVGGMGWMASPVVRYLFREARSHTLGLVARAQIPLGPPPESAEHPAFGGRGMLFLLAFDVGFGRG